MSECVGLTSHHTKEVHIRNQSEWMYFSVRTLENAHWDSWFISIAVLTHLQWNRRFINALAFSQCFCYCFSCYFASLTYLEFDPIFIYVSTHFCNGFVPMVYDFMHAAPISLTSTVHTHTHTHWFAFSYYRNESCRLHLMGVETIDYTFYVHAYTLFRTIFHRLALLMFFSLRSHPRIMSIISSNFHPSVSHIIVQTVQRIAGLAMKCCA